MHFSTNPNDCQQQRHVLLNNFARKKTLINSTALYYENFCNKWQFISGFARRKLVLITNTAIFSAFLLLTTFAERLFQCSSTCEAEKALNEIIINSSGNRRTSQAVIFDLSRLFKAKIIIRTLFIILSVSGVKLTFSTFFLFRNDETEKRYKCYCHERFFI